MKTLYYSVVPLGQVFMVEYVRDINENNKII